MFMRMVFVQVARPRVNHSNVLELVVLSYSLSVFFRGGVQLRFGNVSSLVCVLTLVGRVTMRQTCIL